MDLKLYDIVYGISESGGSFFYKKDCTFAIVLEVNPIRLLVVQSQFTPFHLSLQQRFRVFNMLTNLQQGKVSVEDFEETNYSDNILAYHRDYDEIKEKFKLMTPTISGYEEALQELASLNDYHIANVKKNNLPAEHFQQFFLQFHQHHLLPTQNPRLFL